MKRHRLPLISVIIYFCQTFSPRMPALVLSGMRGDTLKLTGQFYVFPPHSAHHTCIIDIAVLRHTYSFHRTHKAEGTRSRGPLVPRKSNRKHWCYLSHSVPQLDREDPVKTWDHPIMPQNFPDVDFEQISAERSHTAPESTLVRIYYSPPSARRVHLAQLRPSPSMDRESVPTASPWCTTRSSLSPLYLGLSANLSDDMKEMTASWRQAQSPPAEEEKRRSSGALVDVACSGTQTKTQPRMVSIALQTDGPHQGVASVRSAPSSVQSPSASARTHHISTSMEKVNGRTMRPRQTSPKLYRRHSASFPTSATFSSSSLASSSSPSSTPSRERPLLNLSNQGPASAKAHAGNTRSPQTSDAGGPCRAAKPPSKAAGAHRYGLVTEFLRKVSGRAEKPAAGGGPKGKSDLRTLERAPSATRPAATPLHRNDSVTTIVNQRFMKQREEKGTNQSPAISRDTSMSSFTAEVGLQVFMDP